MTRYGQCHISRDFLAGENGIGAKGVSVHGTMRLPGQLKARDLATRSQTHDWPPGTRPG